MTVGILCVFCFCGFAKMAHDDALKALEVIETLEKRLVVLEHDNEDVVSRLTKLEESIDEIRGLVSASTNDLRQRASVTPSQMNDSAKVEDSVASSVHKLKPEIHSDSRLHDLDISKLPLYFLVSVRINP